jgi:hypothetical protein
MQAIFLPIGIGIAIGAALAVVILGAATLTIPLAAIAGIARGLGMRRDAAKRAQWLARAQDNPRRAAMLDWIAAKRSGDKAAQAQALARLKLL